jgi:hypothetical protein
MRGSLFKSYSFSSIFGADENLIKVEKRRVQIIIRNPF